MKKKTIATLGLLTILPLAASAIVSNKTDHFFLAPKAKPETPQPLEPQPVKSQGDEVKSDFDEKLNRIKELKENRDLDRLVEMADEIQSRWTVLGREYGTDLMIEVVGAFSGYDFKDARQHALAIKYAKATLAKGDDLPLQGEIRLVRFLEGGPEYDTGQMKPDQWAQDRRERVKLWLHAWRRFESTINRDFNFNNRPHPSVRPPRGSGPAGIAPESISDPVARAQYAAAIARNNEKIAEYNTQWQLHQLDKYLTPHVKRFLIEAYSKQPYDLEELSQYLATYHINENTKQTILVAVSDGISKNPGH